MRAPRSYCVSQIEEPHSYDIVCCSHAGAFANLIFKLKRVVKECKVLFALFLDSQVWQESHKNTLVPLMLFGNIFHVCFSNHAFGHRVVDVFQITWDGSFFTFVASPRPSYCNRNAMWLSELWPPPSRLSCSTFNIRTLLTHARVLACFCLFWRKLTQFLTPRFTLTMVVFRGHVSSGGREGFSTIKRFTHLRRATRPIMIMQHPHVGDVNFGGRGGSALTESIRLFSLKS